MVAILRALLALVLLGLSAAVAAQSPAEGYSAGTTESGAPVTSLAQADTSGAASTTKRPSDNNPAHVEEIVVTARRKEETLLNVPISVAAFGQQDIQRLAIENIDDLVRLTPGLATYRDFLGGSIPSIRGIRSLTATSTTGIYIDDTPIQVRNTGGAATAAFPSVFDLDRIEVLRGPQGTLFGAGSEGGTLRFITPQPGLTGYSGHARAEAAINDRGAPTYQYGVAGGGPIIADTLGFRVSAYVQEDGGWIDSYPYFVNLIPSAIYSNDVQKNVNSRNTIATNAALSWRVAENLTLTPSVFYQRLQKGSADSYWGNLSNPGNGVFIDGRQFPQSGTQKFALPAVKAEWTLGGANFVSNTSYMDLTDDNRQDYTALINGIFTGQLGTPTGTAVYFPAFFNTTQRQFTQELRAQSSNPNARLSWVIGAFYQTVRVKALQYYVTPTLDSYFLTVLGKTTAQIFGSPMLPGYVSFIDTATSLDKQLAGFGQVDFKLTNEFSVTAGLRYARVTTGFTDVSDGPIAGGLASHSGSGTENVATPKFGLNYKPIDNLTFYTTASKGYRPGGANTPLENTPQCAAFLASLGLSQAPVTYKSDSTWSYEVGSKGESLDKRLLWDASAFYIKWSGIQNPVFGAACGFGFTANLGEAISKGFDLQVKAIPFRNLILSASIGYTDAYYDKTLVVGSATLVSKDQTLNLAPWQGALEADYTAPLGTNKVAYLHVDDSFQSSASPKSNHDPAVGYYKHQNIASLRLGMRVDRWDVSVYSKNVLNTHHDYLYGSLYTVPVVFGPPPRVTGVTATYQF